jgi:hypothetical protein
VGGGKGKTPPKSSKIAFSTPTPPGQSVVDATELHKLHKLQVRFCRDRYYPTGD